MCRYCFVQLNPLLQHFVTRAFTRDAKREEGVSYSICPYGYGCSIPRGLHRHETHHGNYANVIGMSNSSSALRFQPRNESADVDSVECRTMHFEIIDAQAWSTISALEDMERAKRLLSQA